MESFRTVYFCRREDATRVRKTQNLPKYKVECLQEIIKDKISSRVDGVLIDFHSANMVLQLFPSLGKGLQDRLLAMPMDKIIAVSSKLSNK
jgi:hypothetical protein